MSNERPPIGGRRGEKHVDDVRPEGVCYADSIKSHRKFCESLGNGIINPNHEQAQNKTMQQINKVVNKTEGQR